MATTTDAATRLDHEREFHDARYRNDPRAAQDRFYEGVAQSEQAFRALVDRFQPGDRVLELGCGIDSMACDLAARGIEVVAVDISPVAVEQARAIAADRGLVSASFEVMNAEQLEFPDESFDGVIGTAVLHHLDLDAAYRSIARVVKPSGRAVFIEPLGHNRLINAYRDRTPESRTDFEHPLLRADVELAKATFREVDHETFHLLSIASSPIANRRWGKPIHSLLTVADRWILRLPFLRWQAWIVVYEARLPR